MWLEELIELLDDPKMTGPLVMIACTVAAAVGYLIGLLSI